MDQDSFRQLLTSSSSQTRSQPRESLFTKKSSGAKGSTKPATISANEPAFKPRKVKKEGKYRDRAAERRIGDPNDYAQVEAVLEEFEKRTADQAEDAVDDQRRYLGGDTDHSILVKGLDMALLQQNKAKAAMATDEDDSLEQAYIQAASEPTVPKKRTREDIIRELKQRRAQGGEVSVTPAQPSLDKGKFKPIGFKPIGGSEEQKEKKKKTKAKGEGERKKKKKRKIEVQAEEKLKDTETAPVPSISTAPPPLPKPDSPEPPEDLDIFAGAGEYEGVDLGDDEEDGEKEKREDGDEDEEGLVGSLGPGRWFAMDEQSEGPVKTTNSSLAPDGSSISHPPTLEEEGEASDEEPEQPTRLVPLSSSAIPSIKELLAMNEVAEASDKKHKRKAKKKGDGDGKKLDAEAKANRDYQRLKSYTDKKGEPST